MFSQLNFCALKLLSFGYMVRAIVERRSGRFREFQRQRQEFYKTVWYDSASRLGARIDGLGDEVLEVTLGDARTRVRRNYTAVDDPVTLRVAGDKALVHRLLAEQDIPVPAHAVFSLRSLAWASQFLDETLRRNGRPCVVKPAKGTGGGHGVTTGVMTRSQLKRAAAWASRYGEQLLVEEQCDGQNFRLLYLDGHLLDAVKREPPTVVGDGRSDIRTLIERENRARLADGWHVAQAPLRRDADLYNTLARQGRLLRSVPSEGQRVVLKTAVSENAARENLSVTDGLCRSIIETGARAALAVGVRFAGVDVVAPDAGQPLHETGGVVLEVNTTPGLYYHWRRESCPVALSLLEVLLRESQFAPTNWKETAAL